MTLSKSQQTLIAKARNAGSSEMAVPLTDDDCAFLISVIVRDLHVEALFPEIRFNDVPEFFSTPRHRSVTGIYSLPLDDAFDRLFSSVQDADTYFSCLAALYKARLKYKQILQRQPFPTFDQVGPRGLLQYGTLSPQSLTALLYWRKWLYDLDNRAAQDTGYLFEPILAHSIGGAPVSSRKSPIKRHNDARKGRQVDCIRGRRAYEFKLRVTIAASGQGRWREELDFPVDCSRSGYEPVLVVLDPTPNPKLDELCNVFRKYGGNVYIGDEAWEHLESEAGKTMAVFLEKYVRGPLETLMEFADNDPCDLSLQYRGDNVVLSIGDEKLIIDRSHAGVQADEEASGFPDDVADDLPGMS